MTQATTGTAPEPKALPLAVALVRGRLEGKPRKWKDREGRTQYAHLLRLPNPDEFTTLGVVEVTSDESLGEDGETWAGRVRLSGSVRGFNYVDQADGQRKQGRECTIRLAVVG